MIGITAINFAKAVDRPTARGINGSCKPISSPSLLCQPDGSCLVAMKSSTAGFQEATLLCMFEDFAEQLF